MKPKGHKKGCKCPVCRKNRNKRKSTRRRKRR
jgi:hypothetical protein